MTFKHQSSHKQAHSYAFNFKLHISDLSFAVNTTTVVYLTNAPLHIHRLPPLSPPMSQNQLTDTT